MSIACTLSQIIYKTQIPLGIPICRLKNMVNSIYFGDSFHQEIASEPSPPCGGRFFIITSALCPLLPPFLGRGSPSLIQTCTLVLSLQLEQPVLPAATWLGVRA